MKKTLFMLAVAGMAMTGCSNTEVLEKTSEVQMGKIVFDTHVNKPTRADLTTSSLENFWVSGFYTHTAAGSGNIQVFNKTRVYLDKTDNQWKMSANDERYWISGAKYYFFAYSNGGGNYELANFNLADGNLLISEYEVNPNSHENDLIFVETGEIEGKETGTNVPVALTFKHLLSKIQFTFANNFSGDYKINISDLTISGIRSKASYNQAGKRNVWAFTDDRTSCKLSVPGDAIGENKITTGFKYILPKAYDAADIRISFKFDVYTKNTDGTWSTTPIYGNTQYTSIKPEWKAGNQYNYNVELTGGSATGLDKINFTVTQVDEWGKVTEITEGLNFNTQMPEDWNK